MRTLKNKIAYRFTFYVILLSITLTVFSTITLLYFYLSPEWQRVLITLIVMNVVQIFLVAIFILWIFQWMIARHLSKITNLAKDINLEQTTTKFELNRSPRDSTDTDELEQMVIALNQMQTHWQHFYKNLYDRQQHTQHLLEVTLIGLGLWRLDGTVEMVNPALAQILGRSVDDTLKLNYWQDIIGETEANNDKTLFQTLQPGERYGPSEKEFQHRDGYTVPVKLSALMIEQNGERYAWSNVENIAAQKRAALELHKAKQKAEEANRAKSQFLANMSHELRTPMNIIVGYSEMLEEEIKECQRVDLATDVKNIHTSAKHLLMLLDGILDISKIEAGKMELYLENFDVSEMVQHLLTTIQPLINNRSNTLHLENEDNLGSMYSDLVKVRQILLNLLSNATKFTEQGKVTLTAQRQLQEDGEWLQFEVIDEGIGMTPEQQANLFQIFAQAEASISRKYGGTGLGLAVTKSLVEMLGGSIQVESQFGKGSRFTVRLPAQLSVQMNLSKTATGKETLPIRKPSVSMESGTVLVIDDDDVVRNLLQAYLSKIGYQVASADNGPEGIRLAKKLRPNAITLDVMMPGMDGWEVLTQLKADPELAHIPVIVLTMMEDKDIGYSLGAAEYLTKPISRDQLTKVLRKYRSTKAPPMVMIVEDDNTTREMLVRMLHKVGWQVMETDNGESALRLLDRQPPDLILLDLMMPQMDGFEFITHLRQHTLCANTPVVVLTAKDISSEDRTWLTHRVDSVFQKGAYSREELLNNLRTLLANTMSKQREIIPA